jgi:hypothetical protein
MNESELVSMKGVFLFFLLGLLSALLDVVGAAVCFGFAMVVVGSALLREVREE